MNRSLLGVIGTALAAAAAFAVIVPDRSASTESRESWLSEIPEVAAAESLQTARVDSMIELRVLVRRLETRATARALAPAAAPLAFTADPRVPAEVRARFAERVQAEFAALPQGTDGGTRAGRVRVHLAAADGAVAGNYLRYIVLPPDPAAACTVIIETPQTGTRVAPRAREYLLGTCGFYARFGAAGPGMRVWLEQTQGQAAAGDGVPTRDSSDRRPGNRLHRITAVDVIFHPAMAACSAGDDAACESLFDNVWQGRWSTPRRGRGNTQARDVLRGDLVYPLRASSSHLAAMRAELGDARFAEVWKSTFGPAEAYAALEGRSVGSLVRSELLKEIEPYRPGPLAARFPLLLGFVVAGLLGGVTIRSVRRRRS